MLGNLLDGLTALGNEKAILFLVAGTVLGVGLGVLPGLGVALVLSVLLGFIYHVGIVPAIALMLATQAGSYFSASITAILLNTPGAPESLPTTFDGFPMAKRGEAGRALGISATATALGGLVGCVALFGLLQVVDYLPNVFHPSEYVALIVLAIVVTGTLGGSSVTKALLSGALGLMLSFVGSDPVTGANRFTFGNANLYSGIPVVALALGVFAVPQMVIMFGSRESVAVSTDALGGSSFRSQVWQGVRETMPHWLLLVRSALVGVICGVVPGIGGFTANFLSYGIAKQTIRRRDLLGSGIPEGIIAPEGSSLAKEAGSLVPAIGLGLPSGTGMVLFLAALAILGLQPGPGFAAQHASLPYTMLWVVAIGGVLGTVIGLAAAPLLARSTRVKGPQLLPFIVSLAVVGAYASTAEMSTVVEVLVFSLLGFVVRRLNFSLAALTIGLVLGGQLEDQVYLTQETIGWGFLERPLTDILFAIIILVVALQVRSARKKRLLGEQRLRSGRRGSARTEHPLLEIITSTVLLGISIAYVVISIGYAPTDRLLPLIAGVVATASSFALLVSALTGTVRARLRPTQASGEDRQRDVAPSARADAAGSIPSPLGVANQGPLARAEPPAAVPDAADLPNTVPYDIAVGVAIREDVAVTDPGQSAAQPVEPKQWWQRQHAREAIALGWVVLLVLGAWLLGFRVGVPLVVAIYGLTSSGLARLRNRVAFTILSTAVVWLLAWAVFHYLYLTFSPVITL
jgi:putative tricarboxylic transport membrane protein